VSELDEVWIGSASRHKGCAMARRRHSLMSAEANLLNFAEAVGGRPEFARELRRSPA
jgi:hypothetical protein